MIEKPNSKAPEKEVVEDVVTKENSTERQLSEEELKRIFFLSFRFSQGDTKTQKLLFSYIRKYYGKQNIPEEFQEELDMHILSYIKGQKPLSHAPLPKSAEIINESVSFLEILNNEEETPLSIVQIMEGIVDKDIEYLDGRKRVGLDKKVFRSFFVNYILRKSKTGEEALDVLFSEIRNSLGKVELKKVLKFEDDLKKIVNKYNMNSPETKVSEEELSALGIELEL